MSTMLILALSCALPSSTPVLAMEKTEIESTHFPLSPNFPHELVAHIFSFLPEPKDLGRLALVSKKWKNISENETLWKNFGKESKNEFKLFVTGPLPTGEMEMSLKKIEERDRVSTAINLYILKSPLLRADLLHTMRSQTFSSGSYTFHDSMQSIYLKVIDDRAAKGSPLPRYEPINLPYVASFSSGHIGLQWQLKDHPNIARKTLLRLYLSYTESK